MPRYLVRWLIDSEAATARDAARGAQMAQRRRGTTANVFEVRRVDPPNITPWVTIDLDLPPGFYGPASRESELSRLLQEYEDAAFNRGEGEDVGGHKLINARTALYSFLGLPSGE